MLPFVIGYTAGQRTAGRAATFAQGSAMSIGTHHTHRLEDLAERIDSMALVLRGMWALLEEHGYTAEQLIAKIEAIDLVDGVSDRKLTTGAVDCPSCESKVAAGLDKCQFCGTVVDAGDPHPLEEI